MGVVVVVDVAVAVVVVVAAGGGGKRQCGNGQCAGVFLWCVVAVSSGHGSGKGPSTRNQQRLQRASTAGCPCASGVAVCASVSCVMCPCACLPARLCALVGVASHAPWASEQSRSSTTTSGWPSITVGWWVGGWVGGSVATTTTTTTSKC